MILLLGAKAPPKLLDRHLLFGFVGLVFGRGLFFGRFFWSGSCSFCSVRVSGLAFRSWLLVGFVDRVCRRCLSVGSLGRACRSGFVVGVGVFGRVFQSGLRSGLL